MATLRSSTVLGPTGTINSATTPQTLACPAGLAAGDLLVVWEYFAQGIAGTQTAPAPANMVKVSTDGTTPTRIGGIHIQKVTDPSLFASGIVLNSNSAASRVAAIAHAWTPTSGKQWDLTTALCTAADYSAVAAATRNFPALGSSRNLVLGSVMSNKSASTTLTLASANGGTNLTQAFAPSGAVTATPEAGGNTNSVSDSVVAVTRGGTGITYNINQANFRAETFGINEIDIPVDPGPSLPTVTGAGFETVTKFLQTPGATMAHRGLGLTYPEMTEYAYRMAANAGYGMHEISCQRDSEGTFWGIHDQTPNRTVVETTYDGTNISALTSAQVAALHVNVGASGSPQPMATLQQLVNTLPEDHIFAVDPKQSGGTPAYLTEFLDILDGLGGPDRFILKFDGASTATRFQTAQSRGYTTMGYYYAAPATPTNPTNMAANLVYCDLPGLNYDASPTEWATFRTQTAGKKRWAHVIPDQAGYDASVEPFVPAAGENPATGRGADFVQVTSASVTPVGVEAWVAPNVGPTAAFTHSETYLALSVNGSTSSDSDGTIVSYAWTFGDGGTATGVTASHTYAAAGTYTVTLVVTDNDGATGTVSHDVTVAAEPDPEPEPEPGDAPVARWINERTRPNKKHRTSRGYTSRYDPV